VNPTIIVGSEKPYPILAANKEWQATCGYGQEAIGRTPKILQGELTNRTKAATFVNDCVRTGHGRTVLVNYHSSHEPFAHKLRTMYVDGFYVTESEVLPPDSPIRRAVCKEHQARGTTKRLAKELLAITLAISLTCTILSFEQKPADGAERLPLEHTRFQVALTMTMDLWLLHFGTPTVLMLTGLLAPSTFLPSYSSSTLAMPAPASISNTDAVVVVSTILLSLLVVAINEAGNGGPRGHQTTRPSQAKQADKAEQAKKEERADKAIAFSLMLGITCLVVDLAPHVLDRTVAACLCAIVWH